MGLTEVIRACRDAFSTAKRCRPPTYNVEVKVGGASRVLLLTVRPGQQTPLTCLLHVFLSSWEWELLLGLLISFPLVKRVWLRGRWRHRTVDRCLATSSRRRACLFEMAACTGRGLGDKRNQRVTAVRVFPFSPVGVHQATRLNTTLSAVVRMRFYLVCVCV